MGKREFDEVNEALRDAVFTEDEVLSLIHSNHKIRSYYVEVAREFGLETAVFLSQVEWRWVHNDSKPFYKYISKCDSAREGDSWTEELAMGRSTLENILKKVATRVRSKQKAEELVNTGTTVDTLIVYYKPSRGALVWLFNEKLFIKLRAWLLASSEKQEMAISRKPENGHLQENGSSIYSEQTHNSSELLHSENLEGTTEDENIEDEFDALFESEDGVATAARKSAEEKRAAVRDKANKRTVKTTTTQRMIDNQRKGSYMPLDFSLSPSIIAEALEKGFDQDTIDWEFTKYKNFCTNAKPDTRMIDFHRGFMDWWMVMKKQYVKESGTTENAGAARVEGLRELASDEFARGVAEASLADLARDLERYYDSLDDSSDSEAY